LAGPARIDQADLEANFPPKHVRAVFSDDGKLQPGPRLSVACTRASRRAESILLRAWSLAGIDVLYQEDEAVRAETCRLVMAYGVEGKIEWTGQGAPYAGLEKAALSALKDLADAEVRSRAESLGAGQNPRVTGNISSPETPQYVFAPSKSQPRRGGY
jgi:hypothetical protein